VARTEAEDAEAAEAEAARAAQAEIAGDKDHSAARDQLVERLRGVRVARRPPTLGPLIAPGEARPRGPSAAVLAATLFLVGAGVLSLSYMLTHGGLSIRLSTPEPSTVAVASPSPEASVAVPTPTLTPLPTDAPSPSPSPSVTPLPTPTSTPDPRLALLEPCPDTPDCYLYTVRVYDSLGRISRRFKVPVDKILELNPWITDPNVIHPGDVLTLPPPG
jgi:hypothetical protein